MIQSGVYAITNLSNGKVYIGSTIGFEKRWNQHRSDLRSCVHHNIYLQRSWNKYGEDVFEFGVLEYLDNFGGLPSAEQFWMDIYREEGRELYNIGECVDCPWRGQERSKEHKRKLSEANLGKVLSEETRQRMSNSGKGRVFSKEHRRRIGDARMGMVFSEEHRRRLSKAGAKFYPDFIHEETGKIIPAGRNLKALCKEQGLTQQRMSEVSRGKRLSHRGWMLLSS